jgi:serine/threonine protein kinase
MGVVYKAEDLKLKRTVALKFLSPETIHDADAKARFVREAQAAAVLDHSNICTVFEIDGAEPMPDTLIPWIDYGAHTTTVLKKYTL